MKVSIVTDDNARFPISEAQKLGLYVVPMPIVIDGQEKYERQNFSQEEFFQLQAAGCEIHTSQPLPGDVMKIWDQALAESDQVVHVPMSSGLTQSVETAKMLAQDEKYQGRVFVVDNHRISVTLRYAVYDALELIKEGKTGEEIKDFLEQTAHDSRIYIMLDTLKYLLKGGRITPAAAAMGSALHIKPVLKIEGGKLDKKDKAIGSKKAQRLLIKFIEDDIKNLFGNDRDHLVFGIVYSGVGEETIQKVKDFREKFAAALNLEPKQILTDPMSLSVSVHIGPGAIATTVGKVLNRQEIDARARQQEW